MQQDLGRLVGRYRLLALLGTGGFASVYRAEDSELERQVAVKLLHPHLSQDDLFVRRFRAEARAAARLHHPHIVPIHDVGTAEDGRTYLVMELLEGMPLSRAHRGVLPRDSVLLIVSELASAIDYIHSQGLVHRDLKPANVMISSQGSATLMDFGIARSLDDQAHLTQMGQTLGTPTYMAPEQIRGNQVNQSIDIYSLGIVTYELLAGRPPFVGSPTSVMTDQLYSPPPPIRQFNPNLSDAAAQVIDRALAKEPSARPPSATAFADLLGHTMHPSVPNIPAVPRPQPPPLDHPSAPAPAQRGIPAAPRLFTPFLAPPAPGAMSQALATAQLASFWRRCGALAIDAAAAILGTGVWLFASYLFFAATGTSNTTTGEILGLSWTIADPLLAIAAFSWAFGSGWTPGARALGLRIVDSQTGAPPGLTRGFLRALVFGLETCATLFWFGVVGFLWMLWDPRKQTLHDKAARTLVVRRAAKLPAATPAQFTIPGPR